MVCESRCVSSAGSWKVPACTELSSIVWIQLLSLSRLRGRGVNERNVNFRWYERTSASSSSSSSLVDTASAGSSSLFVRRWNRSFN